jgi:hypothetical protein
MSTKCLYAILIVLGSLMLMMVLMFLASLILGKGLILLREKSKMINLVWEKWL